MTTNLGELGVWTWLDAYSAPEAAEFARKLEDWGYTALWVPEAVGRDPFTFLGYLAGQTERLVFATGIANIYARDPMTMKAIHQTMSELATGRFVLGLGVSHQHLVSKVRGHDYKRPLSAMRDFLNAMENALYMGAVPGEPAPIVLAALRDKMLDLAATRTAGAHPYLVPPEHTARARKIMGDDAWLCPEQMVILETDATKARSVAREQLAVYLSLPNYQNNLKQFDFDDRDFENGGSDRLVDAIVVWGDEQTIAERIQAHRNAGASHVCIQPFRPDGQPGPDLRLLEALAPGR
ncbi:MAG: TIGR03620 family F420-dependent LLM class oxidoreductase [Deltaproteobacteria bacterium]|nr:TIGR03620 family F420-dependent LLM class oxidoreductase [Deltaproteobacteria bacterium]MBW2387828.1 TIGR03620 family F420-dependent LLM class oxidoreductase [Deltaproteobacteria bacterium]MBW2725851.1 TIGR03620 family F420-dependent LLM class oxidoreductase [Deltaproteobacteria bacterium]